MVWSDIVCVDSLPLPRHWRRKEGVISLNGCCKWWRDFGWRWGRIHSDSESTKFETHCDECSQDQVCRFIYSLRVV